MKKKLMAIALCTIIGVMAIAGSSLAWLQDSTQTVVNTFTEGKVDIDLYETKDGTKVMANSYKMVPGDVLPKDPTVEVLAVSEECYVFVKVEEINAVDTFLSYTIDSKWTQLKDANGNDVEGVYYLVAEDTDADQTFNVLAGDKVTVNTGVKMEDMNTLNASTYPQLKFTAYAVQKANVDSAAEAWEIFFPTTPTT